MEYRFLTVAEVGRIVRYDDPRTVIDLIEEGVIPGRKVGREYRVREDLLIAALSPADRPGTGTTRPSAADGECPGCVGRGTGSVCCACGLPIPEMWRRSPESPSDIRPDCPGCLAGRVHDHGGGHG